MIQLVSDGGGGGLVYFAFDLLKLDSIDVARMTLLDRKERLAKLLKKPPDGISYSEDKGGDGEAFRRAACGHGLEGVVSRRTDRRYLPGDRGVWVKSKCLNRAEFAIVGWSDPEGSRHAIGALLLGYYEADGRLLYAGRVGTGMSVDTLATLYDRLKSLVIPKMPLAVAPPRKTRFGGPWRCQRCIGSDRGLSPRSPISVGRTTGSCGIPSSSDCDTTSQRARFGASVRNNAPSERSCSFFVRFIVRRASPRQHRLG
jgi:hypothetical protein